MLKFVAEARFLVKESLVKGNKGERLFGTVMKCGYVIMRRRHFVCIGMKPHSPRV